jgi:hypothetical protein
MVMRVLERKVNHKMNSRKENRGEQGNAYPVTCPIAMSYRPDL